MADGTYTPPHFNFKDLTGAVINGITALHVVEKRGATYLWCFRCHCGDEFEARGPNVVSGNTKSCGCHKRMISRKVGDRSRTHGRSQTAEYRIWRGMRDRATNPEAPNAHRYVLRGIDVCERWRNSFAAFFEDMGPRPSPLHTLDRIDNDKGYPPENCRWATAKEQNNNKGSNRLLTFQGRTQNVTQWSEELSINRDTIYNRLDKGWNEEDALRPARRKLPNGTQRSSPSLNLNA